MLDTYKAIDIDQGSAETMVPGSVVSAPKVNGGEILSRKALQFHFSISQWNYRKKDKQAMAKTAADFGVDESRIKTTKQLADPENFKDLEKLVNDFRTFVYTHTSPHVNKGTYILPAVFDGRLKEKIREFSVAFDAEKSVIIGKVSGFIRQAEIDLNGLFDAADYPSTDELESKYSFSHSFDIFSDPSNILVDIVQSEIDSLAADLNQRHNTILQSNTADCWERIFEVVKSLQVAMEKESRTDKRGDERAPIFRDSVIGNIRELVDVLPGLNIAGDINLELARQELEKELAGIDPADLRESSTSRLEVAETAGTILTNLAGYLGGGAAGQ